MAATDPKYCVPAMRSFYEPRAMGEWKRTDRKNAHYIVFVVLIYLQITFYEPISLLIKRTKFLAGESFEPDQPLCKIGATLRRTVDVEIWDPPNGIPIPSLPSPPPHPHPGDSIRKDRYKSAALLLRSNLLSTPAGELKSIEQGYSVPHEVETRNGGRIHYGFYHSSPMTK